MTTQMDSQLTAGLDYRRETCRKVRLLGAAVAMLLVLLAVDLSTGPIELSFQQIVTTLLWPNSVELQQHTVVWILRMPLAVMALLVGAILGVAGAVMQTLLSNPLASPYTLGISASASFGAALAIVFGAVITTIPLAILLPVNAFVWTVICSTVIYIVGRYKNGEVEAIILCGVALLFLFNSGVAFLQFAASEDTLHAIVFWIFGSLQGATWLKNAMLFFVLCISLPWLLSHSWRLLALRLGDEHACSLGIDVPKLRLYMLCLVSLLTALAVCFAGAIGFIGLVAPHLARMTVGEDQRFFLPMSTAIGAGLLSIASITSKVLIPGVVLPLGIVTALFGVPFFFSMVLFQKRSYW